MIVILLFALLAIGAVLSIVSIVFYYFRTRDKSLLKRFWLGRDLLNRREYLLNRAGFGLMIAALVGELALLFVFNMRPIRVFGNAMAPTLSDDDRGVITRNIGGVQRGDIIVMRSPEAPAHLLVLRVIGLPGERIAVDQSGQVYINGKLLEEAYISAADDRDFQDVPEQVVQANQYWVMGDNRNNASDSRDWGTVSMEYVVGKVVCLYWPPNKVGAIR